MRIGIDARLLGAAYGMGRYIELITRRLFVIGSKHEYIIFLNPKMAETYKVPPDASVRIVVAKEPWYGWSEQITWPWRLHRERLDLLWVPQFNVPLLVPCPFVVTIHDMTQWYVPGTLQLRRPHHRLAFMVTILNAVHRARRVIAVSEYTKGELLKNLRIRKEKIKVIHEGPGLISEEAKSSSKEGFYILAVSIWRKHKNFDGLVKAFAKARQENKRIKNAKLVLVGEEDTRYPEIRTTIDRLDLRDVVVAPGSVTDEELDAYYRGARAVIVPSLYEGFGFSGLEAMARGIPVAAARATALPEILGNAAYYFNPSDIKEMAHAIEEIMTNESVRKRLLLTAPKVLKRYSWDEAAKETLQVIENAKSS